MKHQTTPFPQVKPLGHESPNIFDRISDGIVAFDREMNYTFVNKRAGELLGRKPEELISKNYWKEYPEAKGTPFANAYLKALETQQPIIFEDYYQPWNRWFENRIYPSQEGLIIFFTEITERKQREQMLLERERQLSALINNLPGAVFRVRNDPNYTVEYVSDQIAELTGYPADDFRENRRNFRDLMHPDDREWVWNEIQEALKEHRPYEVTYRFIDAYDKVKWNWERGMGIFDANGELQAVEGFVQDITKRKRAEEELRKSENKWRTLVETIPDYVALYDTDGRYEFLNHYAEGYSEKDVVGKHYSAFLPEASRLLYDQIFDRVRRTGKTEFIEYQAPGHKGMLRMYNSYVVPIREGDRITNIMVVAREITEHKRAEETLKESEKRNRIIAEMVSDYAYIFLVTPTGELTGEWMTESFTKVFGYTLEELRTRGGWQSLVYPEDLPVAQAHAMKVASGEPDICEMRWMTARGEIRWLRDYAKPIFDEMGKRVVRIYGASQDITERKRAEEKLRESEVLFRSLIANSADGIVLFKEHGVISFASPSTEKILGYSNDESVGRSVFEFIHPKDQVSVKRKLLELLRHPETPVQIEVRLRHKNGSWRCLEGTLTNLFHVPSVKAIVNNFRDITERKRTEEAHHRSEEKFSIIFKKGPYAAALVNVSDRVIEDVNEEHERLFELSREEFVGKTPEMLNMVIDAEQRKRIADLTREHGFVANEQLTIQLRSGKKIDILLNVNSVQIDGKTYLLTIAKDITEINRKEEQLRALTAHLQTAIEQERARIAREIHDDIGQIFTAIKMDLSLLLRTLQAVKEKKMKKAVTEEIHALIGLLDRGVQSIRKIVRDLRPETLETMGLLAGIEWQAKEFTKRTKIDVSLSLPKKEPELNQQQTVALFRVVQEVLTNAARHADATKVKIHLTIEPSELLLMIEDNGKGISEEDINRPGSFGLIAMRERIHSMGGEITISGRPGKGTRVEVVLKKNG